MTLQPRVMSLTFMGTPRFRRKVKARGRAGQDAHAALGRRGLRGAAGKRPALGLGGDKEKFCQLFQKLRVVGRSPTISGLQGVQPLPSPTPKKGGRMSPSWGGTAPGPRPMRCAVSPAGSVSAERCPPGTSAVRALPCIFSPAAPVQAVELCSTPASRLPPRSAAGQRPTGT